MKLTYVSSFIVAFITFQTQAASGYYVNPGSTAATWVTNNPMDARAPTIKSAVADVPTARWFTGTSQRTEHVRQAVIDFTTAAKNADKTPILVAYNIPGRDCAGGASSGGAEDAGSYRTWIDAFVGGLSSRPAVVILEPDAIADIECLSAAKRSERVGLLKYAITAFKEKAPSAQVYVDAGNAHWKPAPMMATYLAQSGVADAKGFALNVSNFYSTSQTTAYGNQINAALTAAHGYTKSILIDTSRNGNGADPGDWCNPPGRKIGSTQTAISPGVLGVWVKVPGNSDGASSPHADCHGGPSAGTFGPDLAMKLINGK